MWDLLVSFFFLPEVAGLQGLLSKVLSLVSDGLRLLGLPSVICGLASGFCVMLPADQGIAFITSNQTETSITHLPYEARTATHSKPCAHATAKPCR
jgi:hypothetical protein